MRPHPSRRVRTLRLSLAALLACGVLGACGSSDDDSAAAPPTSGAVANSAVPKATPGGAGCAKTGKKPTAPVAGAVPKKPDSGAVSDAVEASRKFLDALGDRRSSALYSYADLDEKRCGWFDLSAGSGTPRGARLGDLTGDQRNAALKAVEEVLSPGGYSFVENAMEGDNQLAEPAGAPAYGADDYRLAVFGEPSESAPWTLQFGGRDVAVHVSLGGDTLAVTPYFKGAQAAGHKVKGLGVKPLGAEAEDIFGLFESLGKDGLGKAKLAGSFVDLVMGPGRDTPFPTPEGLSYRDLSGPQKFEVREVLGNYLEDFAPTVARPLLDLYSSQLDDVRLGWSTSTDLDEPAYLRLDGPRFWIEWVNVRGPQGIHYRTVYRDKLLDYGTGAAGQ